MIWLIQDQGQQKQRIWDIYPEHNEILPIMKALVTFNVDWTWTHKEYSARKYISNLPKA